MSAARPLSVLVVEDNVGMRSTIVDLLRSEGWLPAAASSPTQALGVLDSVNPDLLIVDLGLPSAVDGLGFIRAYRERADPKPILLISGRSEVAPRVEKLMEDYGIAGFLA